MGPLVGAAILLALNEDDARWEGLLQYLSRFVAISALGTPVTLLLSQPQKVAMSDGSKTPYIKRRVDIEARAIWKQMESRRILLLIPIFIADR